MPNTRNSRSLALVGIGLLVILDALQKSSLQDLYQGLGGAVPGSCVRTKC